MFHRVGISRPAPKLEVSRMSQDFARVAGHQKRLAFGLTGRNFRGQLGGVFFQCGEGHRRIADLRVPISA